jgi:hypothetical protein
MSISGVIAVILTAPDPGREVSPSSYREQKQRKCTHKSVNNNAKKIFMVPIIALNGRKVKRKISPEDNR